MWQIQMEHPVQRPITFQMRDGMNDFLRSAHAANSDMPTDVRALEDAVGVRLVVADRTDPEDVGFVQWRVALYVAGDLNNFLLLLDDFSEWSGIPGWKSRDHPGSFVGQDGKPPTSRKVGNQPGFQAGNDSCFLM